MVTLHQKLLPLEVKGRVPETLYTKKKRQEAVNRAQFILLSPWDLQGILPTLTFPAEEQRTRGPQTVPNEDRRTGLRSRQDSGKGRQVYKDRTHVGSQVIARKASAQSSRQMFQHIAWHYKRKVQVTVCSRQTGLPDEMQVPPDQDRAHRCIRGNKARSYFETPRIDVKVPYRPIPGRNRKSSL